MNNKYLSLAVLMITILIAAGCGQKGDLYIEEEKSQSNTKVETN